MNKIKLCYLIILLNNFYFLILTQGIWTIDENFNNEGIVPSELVNSGICFEEGRYGYNCEKTKPEVFQLIPANIEGGEVLIEGYFYDNSVYRITIDNLPCNITSFDIHTIKCEISELKDYEQVDFKIYQNGIIWSYSEYTPFPECENGYLTSGFIKCICNFGFIGTNCNKEKPITINEIITQPEEKGGFFRISGFFGRYPVPMKIIVGENNIVNISFIDTREIRGFVNSDTGCKNISIFDSYTNDLLFNGGNLCFDSNRCNNMYNNQSKDFYCLCEPTFKGFPRCSEYFQKEDNVNMVELILDDYNFINSNDIKDIIGLEDQRVSYSLNNNNYDNDKGKDKDNSLLMDLKGIRKCWEAGYYGDNCEKTKPEVFQLKPAKISGGEVRLIGYFYSYKNYNITIDDIPCNIISRNNYTIKCIIGKLKDNQPVKFKIFQNEIVWNYSQYKPLSDCKFGYISGGFYECHCKFGYVGPNCDKQKQVTIDYIKTQPNSNGGYFRAVGYFGNNSNSLKFIIGSNNFVNVSYIDVFNLIGFVKGDSGCKSLTIINGNSGLKLYEGIDICFISDPCKYIYHDLDYFCLCDPAPKYDPKCSDYVQKTNYFRKNINKKFI